MAIDLPLTPEQKELLKQAGAEFDRSDESDTGLERFYIRKIDRLFLLEHFSSFNNGPRDIIWHVGREISRLEREYSNFLPIGSQKKPDNKQDETQLDKSAISFFTDISHNIINIIRYSRSGRRQRFLALAPFRTEPSREYSHAQSQAKLTSDGRHIPDKLMKLSSSDEAKFQHLQASLTVFGEQSGLFREIKIKRLIRNSNYPFSIMVKTTQGRWSNIKDVGYGVSQILPVIAEIILSRRHQSFLLQQPEVHLHPRAQAAFATFVVNFTKVRRQFVIETHSDFILERLKYEIEQGNIAPDDVGILFFDTEGKDTKIHQIDLGKDGLPKEVPPLSYRKFFREELDRVWP